MLFQTWFICIVLIAAFILYLNLSQTDMGFVFVNYVCMFSIYNVVYFHYALQYFVPFIISISFLCNYVRFYCDIHVYLQKWLDVFIFILIV